MDKEVTIYITEDIAKEFVLFQKNYETFKTLLDSKVFDLRGGSVTLHFDHEGVLQLIQREDVLYSRRRN